VKFNLLWPLVPLIATIIAAYSFVTVYRFAVSDRQARYIRRSFEHYVSPAVVQQLVDDPDRLKLSGEHYETTVLFTDLAGFTPLAERLDPVALRDLLTEYFSGMVDVMLEHDGTLDKFIGDAMMCFFGVPIASEEHRCEAVSAAWHMQQVLDRMNADWQKRGIPALTMRAGVNSGQVVAGNMGTDRLFNYTIMGDCVNLGARLEGANKFYGTRILVGEATRNGIGDEFVFRHIDRATLKGKSQAIDIFELRGPRSMVSDRSMTLTTAYESALASYFRGDFEEAGQAFSATAREFDDNASNLMQHRCKQLQARQMNEWDGVHHWENK
jgi:adenylate cyclase